MSGLKAEPTAVLTGGTGFLGRHLACALVAQGWRLRLLARRLPTGAPWDRLEAEVILGELGDVESLRRLCQGAQVVIHAAGLVAAQRLDAFDEVNAKGAERLAQAAGACAPDAGFVLISSLAARAPQLSAYAQSKRGSELAVERSLDGRATILRLPPLYGPEDRRTLPLFRAARFSPVMPVLARPVRLPLLHVEDAARAIVVLAASPPRGRVISLCDDRPDGYTLAEIMTAAAAASGRRTRLVVVPALALRTAGRAGDLARTLGAAPILDSGKVRELMHADWSLAPEAGAAGPLAARYGLADGFAHTAAWYRAAGWLGRDLRRGLSVTGLWR